MNTVPFSEQERNMTASQDLRIDWKNVPTRTIAAGEVEFAYRELGPNNPGTPVAFLVHSTFVKAAGLFLLFQ